MRPPPGFPRGQKRLTSGRVIVARSFAGRDAPKADHRAFDPNVSEHGTHVSGIVAGAYGTVARPGLGLPVVRGLSGVAPGAWLGNYRGLARGDHETGAIGSTVELAAAVDRAVADGMDVLNLSLGGPQIDPSADALSMALANAARAGVPSVVAAGNSFDTRGYGSISSPGTSATAITVAATSAGTVFGVSGTVSGAGTAALEPFTAVPSIGPRVTRALTRPTRLVTPEAYGLDRRGCRESPRRRRLRAVVVVPRGGCSFGAKAINAHEAGAQAVIVASDRPGPPFVVEEETDVPLLVVTDAVGRALRAYIARSGRAARVRFTRTIAELPTPPRVLTDFSSSGPTPFDLLLKPDIAAPGEAILSSVPLASSNYPGAYASWAGTSMAAPVVTGVVALVRERHPAWTPAQIRAALIGSAVPAYADSDATVEASPLRTGGGFVDAPGAVAPGVLADPPMLGFGLVQPVVVGHGAGEPERRGRRCGSVAGHDRPERRLGARCGCDGPGRGRGPCGGRGAAAGDAHGRGRRARGRCRRLRASHDRAAAPGAYRTGGTSSGPRWPAPARACFDTPGSCADPRAAGPIASSAIATPPTPVRSGCPCAGVAARRSTASTSPAAPSTSA